MRLIISPFTNAAINLSLEELYFKNSTDTICFIYRNQNAVIIGKHQNIFKEVNLKFCSDHNVDYHRRISGGGTVFHDLGNLNISLIDTRTDGYKVDYTPLLDLIKQTILGFGIVLDTGQRNDLYLQGKKVTGTACHVVRDRTLHHGTLLFNTDKTLLHACLDQPLNIKGKGVSSVSSEVTNILDQMQEERSSESFFSEFIVKTSDILYAYIDYPKDEEVEAAMKLKEEKYVLESWNLDYSPPFTALFPLNNSMYTIEVSKGTIIAIIPDSNVLQEWIGKTFYSLLQNYGI